MENEIKNDGTDQTQNSEVVENMEVENMENDTPESGLEVSGNLNELSDDETSMERLMDLYEESFKRFEEGEVVTGKIISLDKDYVLVDIGYKSEGQIPIHEFKDEKGEVAAKVGDAVEVMVEWWDDEEEVVVLSKEKAEKIKVWDEIKKAYDDGGTVDGVITNRVKGGFSVDIGVQAFLPGSQADLRP
ncbi:MAG: S1 RNA-binding domain-containing protein, partial [Desulfococcus multivorans]|nr:S1 RNA-binding domain-containing protein [Desulfococcus multivorans]